MATFSGITARHCGPAVLPVTALPILTPDEQQKILVDWNATRTTIPKDKTLQQLFEAQVERNA